MVHGRLIGDQKGIAGDHDDIGVGINDQSGQIGVFPLEIGPDRPVDVGELEDLDTILVGEKIEAFDVIRESGIRLAATIEAQPQKGQGEEIELFHWFYYSKIRKRRSAHLCIKKAPVEVP
jgi:hypothetical protein